MQRIILEQNLMVNILIYVQYFFQSNRFKHNRKNLTEITNTSFSISNIWKILRDKKIVRKLLSVENFIILIPKQSFR